MDNYSIIIPTYKERKNLPTLITEITKHIKNITYEIIIVDDNSKDGTENILKKIKKKKKFFYFFIRKKNKKDLCQSIFLGIKKSKYNNIIVMDGDLQHNPKYLPIIIKKFSKKNIDFLICVRDFKKKYGLSFLRYYSSLLLIILVKLLLGNKVSDPMSGFFIFKKKIYFSNKKNLYGKGFKILLDLIYSSKKSFKIHEHKIIFDKRRNNSSKMNLNILYHIILSIYYKLTIKLFR